jgi:hypothetical protein
MLQGYETQQNVKITKARMREGATLAFLFLFLKITFIEPVTEGAINKKTYH